MVWPSNNTGWPCRENSLGHSGEKKKTSKAEEEMVGQHARWDWNGLSFNPSPYHKPPGMGRVIAKTSVVLFGFRMKKKSFNFC